MTEYLSNHTEGTDLIVLAESEFADWQSQLPSFQRNWLSSTQFKGKGLALIPNEHGELFCALLVSENPMQRFASGDLSSKLPPQHFVLQCDAQYQASIAFGWVVGAYQFDRYVSKTAERATLGVKDEAVVSEVNKLANGVALVRDLVNTPAGDMMPQHLASATKALADEFGGTFSEVVGDELLTQNYPTIHAVGRASCHPPRLIELNWGDTNAPKVTLVGKGVCFDSGGLDIKPAAGMRQMKKDMGGAAHVLGLARLIMDFGLKVNLRVLVPAVENAISDNAFRPGDVIKTRKGITVEIDNTDAEGRLVLCDALDDAANQQPELIIDFATLTGAMRVALGTELPGFFATKDETAAGITAAGLEVEDPVWRMPLHRPYFDLLKSDVADMTNCAAGPFGGAITAALYLQEFLPEQVDWCHFDIMALNNRALPGRPKGGEAFGIRAVLSYLQQRYGQ